MDRAVPQQAFTQRGRHRGHVDRDVAGHRQRVVEDPLGGQGPVGDPERHGLGPAERPAGEQDVGGHPQGGQLGQRPVRHAVGDHAPPYLHHTVFGVLGQDPDVRL